MCILNPGTDCLWFPVMAAACGHQALVVLTSGSAKRLTPRDTPSVSRYKANCDFFLKKNLFDTAENFAGCLSGSNQGCNPLPLPLFFEFWASFGSLARWRPSLLKEKTLPKPNRRPSPLLLWRNLVRCGAPKEPRLSGQQRARAAQRPTSPGAQG